MKTITKRICCILIMAVSAGATNYTVKASGGGNYTTISACAAVAVAGDTCTVYAGSYAGWTQTTSGSSGSPITFTVNPGDTVTITSNVNISSGSTGTTVQYITIGAPDAGGGCIANATSGGAGGANPSFMIGGCFVFNNAGISGPTCGSGGHVNYFHLAYNTFEGSNPPFVVSFEQGGVVGTGCQPYVDTTSSNNYIGHNNVNWNLNSRSAPFCNNQILVSGNNNLLEYNDMQGTGAQHYRIGGSYNILRDSTGHDDNGNVTLGCGQSPEHIDFLFQEGGDEPALSYSLIERGAFYNCTNDAGNCKYSFARSSSAALSQSTNVITRYGFIQNTDGNLGGAGDNSDGTNTTPNWHMYNNTIATGGLQAGSGACGTFASGIGVELNSICYNTQGTNGYSPIDMVTSGSFSNGNLAYDTTCPSGACTWSGGLPSYIDEPSYSRLANKNPSFANFPTDGTLSTGSPALAGGVTDTTVSSGCGTTSLVVADAAFFQAGWGPANLPSYTSLPPGDVIRVDNSTYQLTAVNYTTNTLTTTTAVTCNAGDPASLYESTDGTVVFPTSQSEPDVGAFSSSSSSGSLPPSPPSALKAIIN